MNESFFVNTVYQSINLIDSILSIFVSGIVVYLFIFKRKSISSLYHLLLNYSIQMTLKELEIKLEKLNDYDVEDDLEKIIIILNEIVGQMKGNPILTKKCNKILKKISNFAENPNIITEPKKRSIVSELRETLRTVNIQTYNKIVGEDYE